MHLNLKHSKVMTPLRILLCKPDNTATTLEECCKLLTCLTGDKIKTNYLIRSTYIASQIRVQNETMDQPVGSNPWQLLGRIPRSDGVQRWAYWEHLNLAASCTATMILERKQGREVNKTQRISKYLIWSAVHKLLWCQGQ